MYNSNDPSTKFIFDQIHSYTISYGHHSFDSCVVFKYELVLAASDSLNENFTKISITVRDKNDLPPSFPEKLYTKPMNEEIPAPFQMIQVK